MIIKRTNTRITKRITVLILILTIVAGLMAGCAKKSGEENVTEAETTQETVSSKESTADEKTQSSKPAEDNNATAEDEGKKKQLTNADIANYEFKRDSFPKLDGSTSMVPLGKAIASVLLGEDADTVSDLISFNKTTQSFRNLKDGICDLLIVGEPNAAVFKEMEEEGFEYELEEIATDGLIFVVNKENPVDNLTTDQIRDIYSGKISNWKQVGGNDAPIVAFQRNEGAGSQALIKKLVMKDTPMIEAPSTLIASEMGELMESVKSYDNSANAIGYSVYYYANDMKKAEGLKLISVDGVSPSDETIRSRQYPHLNAYYCVIGADKRDYTHPARVMYDWLMSKDGQTLIAAEGYVAAKNPDELKTELSDGLIVKTDYTYYRKLAIPENKYTRLSEGEMTKFKPSKEYGFVYPYSGSVSYVNDGEGYSYEAGSLMGFFDEKARLLTDPIYNSIEALDYYDDETREMENLPVWIVSRVKDSENMEYTFVAMDGSYSCDKWYDYIEASEDRIICTLSDNGCIDVYDLNGKQVLSTSQLKQFTGGDETYISGVRYGDGLYLINISFEETYFVDESGKIVMGPFDHAQPFKDGRAVVGIRTSSDYYYSMGLMDKNGNWIIEPCYDQMERLRNGNYLCHSEGAPFEVYDKNGKFKNEAGTGYAEIQNFGFSVIESDPDPEVLEDKTKCFDFDGNLIFEDQTGEWKTVGRDGIVYRNMGAGIQLKNIFTGETIYVEGADQANPVYRLEDSPDVDRIIVRNSFYDVETDYYYCHERVYNSDLKMLFDKQDVMLMIERDVYKGDWYMEYDLKGNKVCMCDIDFNELCVIEGYPKTINGKFITTDEYACTCYDENGEIVFSYSLINSMGD